MLEPMDREAVQAHHQNIQRDADLLRVSEKAKKAQPKFSRNHIILTFFLVSVVVAISLGFIFSYYVS